MGSITITLADDGDIDRLLAEMRPCDVEECKAYGIEDWPRLVRETANDSTRAWSAYDGEGLVAVFGVAPLDDERGYGSPWMLCTPRFDAHHRDLVRIVPPYLTQMREMFPRLMNWVWSGNTKSIRWLQRIGFHVEPPKPFGMNGSLFHCFHMEA